MSLAGTDHVDVAVIGAGSVGIAIAYYLVKEHGLHRIALIDPRDPMRYRDLCQAVFSSGSLRGSELRHERLAVLGDAL